MRKLGNYTAAKQEQMKQNLSKQKFCHDVEKVYPPSTGRKKSAQKLPEAKTTRKEKLSNALFERKDKYFETSRKSNKISVNFIKENALTAIMSKLFLVFRILVIEL